MFHAKEKSNFLNIYKALLHSSKALLKRNFVVRTSTINIYQNNTGPVAFRALSVTPSESLCLLDIEEILRGMAQVLRASMGVNFM